MTPSIEQLRILVKIVEAGSLTRAADVLSMQRSNISRALAQLEAGLGVTLVERSTRSLSVTEVGRVVYERALNILEALEDTVSLTQRQNDEPRGVLRLTCGVEFGMAALGNWVEAYLEKYPNARVEVEYASREIDLVHEGFDLAVRAGPLPPSRLSARTLGAFRYGLYASPTYLERRSAPAHPHQLPAHDLVVFTGDGGASGWLLESSSAREHIRSLDTARLRVNAGAAVRSALLRHVGIGLLPNLIARELVACGLLQQVLPAWEPAPLSIHAVFPRRRYLAPKVRAFIDLAVERFPA